MKFDHYFLSDSFRPRAATMRSAKPKHRPSDTNCAWGLAQRLLIWGRAVFLPAIVVLQLDLQQANSQSLGEALKAPHLVWTTGGDAMWFSQTVETHDGVAAAQSGPITHNQESWVETQVTGPGLLSFWWKVSSENFYDFLRFAINGEEHERISDEIDWQQQIYEIPVGDHVLGWSYIKDESVSSGADAGWLDEVTFGPATAPDITGHPVGGTVNPGDDFTFSVTVTGNPGPAFRWRLDGAPLPGASNSTLVLTDLQPAHSGWYDVVVTNSAGSVTSGPALLTVYVPPPLAEPFLDIQKTLPGVELTVPADAGAGLIYVFQGGDLGSLTSQMDLLIVTNMPTTADLRVPLQPTNQARFYRALRIPGDLGEVIVPSYELESDSPVSLWNLGLPDPVVEGVTYTTDFLLAQSMSELALFSGPATLSIRRLADGVAHPDAKVHPEVILFSEGSCRTEVLITASSSLEGYVVAVTLSLNSTESSLAPHRSLRVRPASSIEITLIPGISFPTLPPLPDDAFGAFLELLAGLADPNPNYASPVPSLATTEVSGTFGEWRGHKRDGAPNANTHTGLDLAAAATTAVTAARGGHVSQVGQHGGYFVVVDHRDGFYTRYLHLGSVGVAPGQLVRRGDPLGTVGSKAQTRYNPHLHFELREGPAGSILADRPGTARDPLDHPGMFSPQTPQRKAMIQLVAVTPENPGTTLYEAPTQPVGESGAAAYVILQICHPENGRRLAPKGIRFETDSYRIALSTPRAGDIVSFLPASLPAAGGFARYAHGTSDVPVPSEYFRYWFRWDVSGYASSSSGPRTFSVTTTNYANMTTDYTLKWGPQVLSVDPVDAPVNDEQRYRLRVRAWMGEAADTNPEDVGAGDWTTGADWLRYELPAGAKWVANNSTILKETASGLGPQKLRTNDFLWDINTAGVTHPVVTVGSRTTPSITHEWPFLVPAGMVLIPAGSFAMGDTFDDSWWEVAGEHPVHTVNVSALYMDKYHVTKARWDEVYQWAIANGYGFDNPGSGKGLNHPVHTVSWYDSVKWCNARSEREGLVPAYYTSAAQTTVYRSGRVDVENDWVKWNAGYRLPTEAEWEKAARGGTGGRRFPWGNTITHSQANYYSDDFYIYDVSSTRGHHPSFQSGGAPYTSPVGSFEPNGHGLYDMAGNSYDWCWDWFSVTYYSTSPGTDPRGPASGSHRVLRGGSWGNYGAVLCRVAYRDYRWPVLRLDYRGFRSVRAAGQ